MIASRRGICEFAEERGCWVVVGGRIRCFSNARRGRALHRFASAPIMGTGMCSRRQKGLLQTGFCLVTVACLGSGVFMYNHLQQKVRNAEALAQKYKQQQEALSAQLQGE